MLLSSRRILLDITASQLGAAAPIVLTGQLIPLPHSKKWPGKWGLCGFVTGGAFDQAVQTRTASRLLIVNCSDAYVRWLGNRKGIEEQTTTWDKTVIDRQADLKSWVVVLQRLVQDKRIRKIFAFANNHLRGARSGDSKIV